MTRENLNRKCKNNTNTFTVKKRAIKKENEEKEEKRRKKNNEKKSIDDKTALFFSYIKGYRKDVVNLKKFLNSLGWKCIDVEVNGIDDFQTQFQKKIKRKISGTMIVFYFGYGYDRKYSDQIFLGSSTKESISYELFYDELTKFQENNEVIILFTNTCYRDPAVETLEHIHIEEEEEEDKEKEIEEEEELYIRRRNDVYHFFTRIVGTCERGSLLTHSLLNNVKKNKKQEEISFFKLRFKLYKIMYDGKMWNNDIYGVSRCWLFYKYTDPCEVIVPFSY